MDLTTTNTSVLALNAMVDKLNTEINAFYSLWESESICFAEISTLYKSEVGTMIAENLSLHTHKEILDRFKQFIHDCTGDLIAKRLILKQAIETRIKELG